MENENKNTLVSVLKNAGYPEDACRMLISNIILSGVEDDTLSINSSLKDFVEKLGKSEGGVICWQTPNHLILKNDNTYEYRASLEDGQREEESICLFAEKDIRFFAEKLGITFGTFKEIVLEISSVSGNIDLDKAVKELRAMFLSSNVPPYYRIPTFQLYHVAKRVGVSKEELDDIFDGIPTSGCRCDS